METIHDRHNYLNVISNGMDTGNTVQLAIRIYRKANILFS